MTKIAFIINPISGTKSKDCVPNFIDLLLDKSKIKADIFYTERAGHASEMAEKFAAEGYDVVAAVGGDGTVNEVAKALTHTNTALAIIPFGSGNGLARHLDIPLQTNQAIAMLNNFKVAEIDYGTANDIKFFTTCGVGFDAQIGHSFASASKRGFWTYLKSIVRIILSYKSKKYKLKQGDDTMKKRAFLVTFANAAQYGNNAYIAPKADIQDGLIDVCILEPFPFYKVPTLGIKLFNKKIDSSNHLTTFKTNEITIKRRKKHVFHFDGEPAVMKKKIVIKSVNKGLRVAVLTNSQLQTIEHTAKVQENKNEVVQFLN